MQLKQLSPDTDYTAMDESELLMAHATVHSLYKEVRGGREIEDWDMDGIVQAHDTIREQLDENELPHQELNALDDEAIPAQQSMEATTQVTDWAKGFTEAEQKAEFIDENPPESDWFIEAIQAVQDIDESIDLTEYVTLSHTPYQELNEWAQQWLGRMELDTPNQYGAIGYQYNEETETGVGLLKSLEQSDEPYVLFSDSEILERTDDISQAYTDYSEMAEVVERGETIQQEESGSEEEVEQGKVVGTTQQYDWYVWEEGEAQQWMNEKGFDTSDPIQRDGHLIYVQRSAEELFELFHEYRGPAFHDPHIIPEVDGRPILFRMGYPNEEWEMYEDAVVQMIAFRVEEPVGSEEIQQAGVLESDTDFYWYQWDKNEADVWLQERDMESWDSSDEGNFQKYVIADDNSYESEQTVWEGKRARPDEDELPAEQKPRRVTYGVDEDGERHIKAIEFLTEPTFEQMASQYVTEQLGMELDELVEELQEDDEDE